MERLKRAARILLPLAVLAAAAWALRRELSGFSFRDVERGLAAIPGRWVALAALATAADYARAVGVLALAAISGYLVLARRGAEVGIRGLASQIPGGLGVFDMIVIAALTPSVPSSTRRSSTRSGAPATSPAPVGLRLPFVLAHVAAVASRGLKGVVTR